MICKHCEKDMPENGFPCRGEAYQNLGEWYDAHLAGSYAFMCSP